MPTINTPCSLFSCVTAARLLVWNGSSTCPSTPYPFIPTTPTPTHTFLMSALFRSYVM